MGLFYISWTDITQRLISNQAVGFMLCAIVPFALIWWHTLFWQQALWTLGVGFLLFYIRVIGAGDIKLLTVLMFAVPDNQVLSFLFFVTAIGGLLAVGGLLFFRQNVRQQGLPYGVAISGGFLIHFILEGMLFLAQH